ncbi:hypothetical protein GOV09_07025 [Candidatus Woesearchaeota archaeon]|nr:hypothetical protein [Candidatus Woesearchaeota archaeon]
MRRSSHRRHEEHDARIADERLEIAVAILFNHNGCFRTRDGTKNYASHFSAEEQATAREIYRNEYAGNLSK